MDCGSIGIGFDSGISKGWDGRFDDFKIFQAVQSIFLRILNSFRHLDMGHHMALKLGYFWESGSTDHSIWSHSSGVSADLSRYCRLWRSWYEIKEVLFSWTGFDFCRIIDGCWITSGCCWTIGCCWKACRCSGLDMISQRIRSWNSGPGIQDLDIQDLDLSRTWISLLKFPSWNVAWKEPFRIASSTFF